MGSFAIHPAAARLGASAQVLLRQELICRLSRWMPPFMLLPVFASIGGLTLCRESVLFTLDAVGLALSVATLGITAGVNGPLNRLFAGWSPDKLPQDWQSHVERWNVAHSARTVTAVAAFVCAILARS